VTLTWVALAAVTVKVEELPEVMDVGLALIFTVGAGELATVIVAVAVLFPPDPVAVAV
jgi:hypothetical protein